MSPLPFGDAKGEKWRTITLPTVREEDMLLNLTCLDSLNMLWQEKEEMEKIAPSVAVKAFPFAMSKEKRNWRKQPLELMRCHHITI